MNKSNIITKLEGAFEKVGEPVLVSDFNTVKTYDVNVFAVTESGAIQKTISFYVVDEGGAEESAYLRNPETSPAFTTALTTFIASKEGTGGIKKITVDEVNDAKEFAEVTAFILTTGTVTKNKYFIVKEAGKLEFYPLA